MDKNSLKCSNELLASCFPQKEVSHTKYNFYFWVNYFFNIHANTESHKLTAGTWLIFAYVCGRDAGARQDDGNKKAGGGTEHAYSTDERVCVGHSVSQLLWYEGAQKHSNNPCHHCDSSKDVTFTRERRNSVVINFSLTEPTRPVWLVKLMNTLNSVWRNYWET